MDLLFLPSLPYAFPQFNVKFVIVFDFVSQTLAPSMFILKIVITY